MMKQKRTHKKSFPRKSSERGNIFFMLFASVALIGAITVGANNTFKGIVTSMSDVTRKTIAEEKMMGAARISIQASTTVAGGDCDADGVVEPLPFRTATGTFPAGGGWVPANIGATEKDPWGTPYGYCVWDQGSARDTAGCGGPGANRLSGSSDPSQTVVAVISAGKDRKFSSTCEPAGAGGGDTTTGLVHHWQFDEGAGTSANDAGSGNSDGIFVNTPAWTAGKVGPGSLTFNGTNNFVRTPTSAVAFAQGTLSAWVYPTVANPAIVEMLVLGSREPNRIYLLHRTNGNLGVRLGTGAEQDTGDALPINTWSHVSMIWSGGTWRAYLNGTEVGTGAYGGLSAISDCPSVGAYHDSCSGVAGPDAYFTGRIDDARIYNRALSPTDISALSSTASGGSSVTLAQGSDDIILEYTYEDAAGIGGEDLWKVKDVNPDTAIIDKNIEVAGTTEFGGALNLMGSGLILPDSTVTGACDTDADQTLRMNFTVSPPSLEICDYGGGSGLGWTAVSMADSGGGGPAEEWLPADIISWWKFDETSGTSAVDAINGYNGTLTNEGGGLPAWSSRDDGGSVEFNTDNSVRVPEQGDFDFTTGESITIAAWIKPDPFNADWGAILNKGTFGQPDTNYSLFQGNGAGNGTGPEDMSFVITSGAGNYNNMSVNQDVLTQGVWQHVAVTFTFGTASSARFYVNGVQYTATTAFGNLNNAPTQNNGGIIIGHTNQTEDFSFDGGIDDVMLFNRGLTAAEIMNIYHNTGGFTVPPDVGGGADIGDLPTGVTGYWKFDEGSGTTAADSSGNNLTGTFNGSPAWVTGKSGGALDFDANSVEVADNSLLDLTGANTISLWIKPNTITANKDIMGKGDGFNIWQYSIQTNSEQIGPWFFNNGTATGDERIAGTGNVFFDDTWMHYAQTFDPATDTFKIYINGVLTSHTNYGSGGTVESASFKNTIQPFYIGSSGYSGAEPDAVIDEVVVYNRALSASEVTQLYTATGGTSSATAEISPANAVAMNANVYSGRIAAGGESACAIKPDRSLWCWGSDGQLALGNGTVLTGNFAYPSRVNNEGGFTQVTTGNAASCGLKTDGTLWCWGLNNAGKLGLGDTTDRASPVQVGTARWTNVSVGFEHTCGIQTNGAAYCWGGGAGGKLGNASSSQQNSPVAVNTASGGTWSQISAGDGHTCGIKTDGSAWCWGDDGQGRLGNDTAVAGYNVPKPVTEQGPWVKITAGRQHTCGLKLEGSVWCWGRNNRGQLGIGAIDTNDHPIPLNVTDSGPWLSVVAAQTEATCGIKTNGTAWCWGKDDRGSAGDGTATSTDLASPSMVSDPGPWVELTYGGYPCAMKADGSAWCWGANAGGQSGWLGTNDGSDYHVPGRVVNFPDIPPFRYTGNTVLEAPSTNNIAMGTSGISYDGANDVTPQPDGLTFPGSGRTRVRFTGSSSSMGPTAGLTHHWKLDEAPAGPYQDSIGTNHCTPNITQVESYGGKVNKAIGFNPDAVRLNCGAGAVANAATVLTWGGWFKRNTDEGFLTAGNTSGSNASDLVLLVEPLALGGSFACYVGGAAAGSESAYIDTSADTNWHHVVCVFDGSQTGNANRLKLYIDGVQQSAGFLGTIPAATATHVANWYMGTYNGWGNDPADGRIDDVRTYSLALTASEILAWYNATGAASFGSELKVETTAANSAAQISMKAADGTNTFSVGIDYTNSIFKFGPNNAGVTNWMNAVTQQMEILPSGNVGVGTSGTAPFRLNINGGLKVGDDTAACTAAKNGTLKYVAADTPPWKYCDGGAWIDF